MSFTPLTPAQVLTGEPVTTELFDRVRTNLDDHESRISTVEAANVSFLPIDFAAYGPYTNMGSSQTEVMTYRCAFNLTLLAARLQVKYAGTAGTLEVNVLVKRGGAAFTSIFSTRPSVAFGSGDYAISSNAVINPSYVNLLAGDLLRLDITGVQTLGNGFTLYLEWEPT